MTKDTLLNPGVNEENTAANETSVYPTELLMTAAEVAKYLRLKPNTVRAMARDGKLPAIKVGRGWRFPKEAITNFVRLNAKEG